MSQEPVTNEDNRELVNRLFATATAMLEDSIEVAVAGQSPKADLLELAGHGGRLRQAVQDIAIIAQAAKIVAAMAEDGLAE